MNQVDYKWVVHGFYFNNEKDYQMALKDEEKYTYVMNQVAHSGDKQMFIDVFNKLNEGEKFKTVVGMARLKELYNYILKEGIASESDLLPIEGFAVSKIHQPTNYSYAQLTKFKDEYDKNTKKRMIKYKNTVDNLKITICVLCILVGTLFYFGINKHNASNYASAKESVQDEYAQWESELVEREQAVKLKEEELKNKEEALKEEYEQNK